MDERVYYAVGDVHGQAGLLADLHSSILRRAGDRPACIVHLGDLVDRGPDSRRVIETVITLQAVAPGNV